MADPVYDRFMAYSAFGDKTSAGQIDSNMFAKLCKGQTAQRHNRHCRPSNVRVPPSLPTDRTSSSSPSPLPFPPVSQRRV